MTTTYQRKAFHPSTKEKKSTLLSNFHWVFIINRRSKVFLTSTRMTSNLASGQMFSHQLAACILRLLISRLVSKRAQVPRSHSLSRRGRSSDSSRSKTRCLNRSNSKSWALFSLPKPANRLVTPGFVPLFRPATRSAIWAKSTEKPRKSARSRLLFRIARKKSF